MFSVVKASQMTTPKFGAPHLMTKSSFFNYGNTEDGMDEENVTLAEKDKGEKKGKIIKLDKR